MSATITGKMNGRKTFLGAMAVVSALIVAGFLFVLLSLFIFFGGKEGIIHGWRRLPDFTSGKPAAARAAYIAEITALDTELVKLSTKQFDMVTSDICERSQYNWKVKSNYLSSCERRVSRLYLSDQSVCELLPILQRLADDDRPNDGGCKDMNPYSFNSVFNSDYEGNSITIEFMDRQASQQSPAFHIYDGLFGRSRCPFVSYCETYEGDYQTWKQMIANENYPTVIVLEANKTYYRE